MNTQAILDLYLEEFVRSGRKLNRRDIELQRYLKFCLQQHEGQVDYISAQRWLDHRSTSLNPQSLAMVQNRISRFTDWARLLDKSIGPIPRARRVRQDRRTPIIVNKRQVAKFIGKQRALPSRKGINPKTFATITGLLYTTGLRVGEALNLKLHDLDVHKRCLCWQASILPMYLAVAVQFPRRQMGVALIPPTAALTRPCARQPDSTTAELFTQKRGCCQSHGNPLGS